jgi:putative aldouronate transport system permease protein
VLSDLWTGLGWGSIIYLAALSGIDMEQYEAAIIDGANRWQKIIHIDIPGISPTMVIMFILGIGGLMGSSLEKVLLMYNPFTYETSDVIATYVYRMGIQGGNYSYSAAVDLMTSVIAISLVLSANIISRKISETSLW